MTTRMLKMSDKDIQFPGSYHYYPVQAWQFGRELLWIGTGGESVVAYSLRFKSMDVKCEVPETCTG